ncbi:Zinc finger CCCH domain-containing protein [Quillaja saponaria]|uniref:Zinc finger CCCH domain-containing protein n=1 Tax=Quillaja saponaria TaxID=32244 RepID=A0AAD7QC98_QUISA|nr:Zinc finger CCCH domain-containing protein [Quillaja saponaria]
MSFPDHHSPFLPQQHFAADSDAIDLCPQFHDEQFDRDSPFEQPPPYKRPRNSESDVPPPNPPVNKRTTSIFFKTRICIKFKMGTCRNGENCNFAHGIEDMRQPPPNWQELVGSRDEERSSGNWEDDQKIIHKMKLCKKFYNGEECPYGERCNFLHEEPAKFREDSGKFRESSAISIGTTNTLPMLSGSGSNNPESNRPVNAGSVIVKPIFWRTRLCVKWETTGVCPFGDNCHFAHGQAELQAPGGRIEAESKSTGTVPDSAKPITITANNPSPNITASVPASFNEIEQGKKCLLKWKGLKKIDRIYGDWLDDVPLVPNLPSKVET